jgi:putative flippase GtrA
MTNGIDGSVPWLKSLKHVRGHGPVCFCSTHGTAAVVRRWLKFSTVGAAGVAVQTTALFLFVRVLGVHYLTATALAVETAVIHNFIWHRRWTWSDRTGVYRRSPGREILLMLARFNLTNGLVSIVGNLILMRGLAGAAGLGVIGSNLLTIALCSLINFVLADRFVFQPECASAEDREAGELD